MTLSGISEPTQNLVRHLQWTFLRKQLMVFNPFSTNVPLLYPLKTSENWKFSDIFRRYRSGTLFENELNVVFKFCKKVSS